MPSILIIDDEKHICETFGDLFTGHGFRVHIAYDGDHGIRLARAHSPDIILSDIRMPGISGHEAVAAFRQIPGLAATPVILITGNADLADMRKGMTAGADDYLAKPVSLNELLETVQRHLARSKIRREALRTELIAERHHTGNLLPNNLIDPLHEIIGCASVLEGDAHIMAPTDIHDFARNIISGAETLNQRLENFLLHSRLASQSLIISPPENVALDESLSDLAQQTARRHHRVNSLNFSLDPITTAISRELLFKAIAEVIDNACRYSLASEPIDISLVATETDFSINVTDYGMGISEALISRLETADISSGFGLSVSRQLTEILGGKWQLENRPKRGVAVTFTFPLA